MKFFKLFFSHKQKLLIYLNIIFAVFAITMAKFWEDKPNFFFILCVIVIICSFIILSGIKSNKKN